MSVFPTEDQTRSVFGGDQLNIRLVLRADEPQQDRFRITRRAVWHFEVRLRGSDSELCPDAALGIHEFEGLGPDKRNDRRFGPISLGLPWANWSPRSTRFAMMRASDTR